MTDVQPILTGPLLRTFRTLLLSMVLGAALGYLAHYRQPPVYEAQVTLNIYLDVRLTGPLAERDVDQALGTAGWLLAAPPVLEPVAQQFGLADAAALARQVSVERLQNRWTVHVRDTDPQRAADIANQIGEQGLRVLQEAYTHALKAHALRQHLVHLEDCLAAASVAAPSTPPPCRLDALPQLQREIEAVAAQILAENAASYGLVPALTFSVSEWATPPQRPVLFGRAAWMLAGALLGLLLALGWLAIRDRRGRDD